MSRALLAIGATTLVLAAACGSRTGPPTVSAFEQALAAAPATGQANGAATAGGSAVSPEGATRARGGAPATAVPRGVPAVQSFGDFPLAVRVTPPCAVRGTAAVATIETDPGAGLALLVSYAGDRNYQGPWTFGNADATGRFAWTFNVAADAPVGPAEVLAAATRWVGHGGATGRAPFRVAPPGAC